MESLPELVLLFAFFISANALFICAFDWALALAEYFRAFL